MAAATASCLPAGANVGAWGRETHDTRVPRYKRLPPPPPPPGGQPGKPGAVPRRGTARSAWRLESVCGGGEVTQPHGHGMCPVPSLLLRPRCTRSRAPSPGRTSAPPHRRCVEIAAALCIDGAPRRHLARATTPGQRISAGAPSWQLRRLGELRRAPASPPGGALKRQALPPHRQATAAKVELQRRNSMGQRGARGGGLTEKRGSTSAEKRGSTSTGADSSRAGAAQRLVEGVPAEPGVPWPQSARLS